MEMYDDASSEAGPVSSFQSLAAEGDIHAKQGEFRKAAESYTKALVMRSNEKNVLVARSRCYLALGDHRAAMEDVEAALREDKDFFKAKYQKAEVLYARGDFEMALVYYHRGHALRPELEEFRLGIQKAREAIDNSIGSKPRAPASSRSNEPESNRLNELKLGKNSISPSTLGDNLRLDDHTTSAPASNNALQQRKKDDLREKSTIRALLGEMYPDKEYLDAFLLDKDFALNPNEEIRQKISEGLRYLDARLEFWSQQKPIYARRKEGIIRHHPATAKN